MICTFKHKSEGGQELSQSMTKWAKGLGQGAVQTPLLVSLQRLHPMARAVWSEKPHANLGSGNACKGSAWPGSLP